MAEATPLPSEQSRSVSALARVLAAGARTRAMYPAGHPAVTSAAARCLRAIADACGGQTLELGVTPESIIVGRDPGPNSPEGLRCGGSANPEGLRYGASGGDAAAEAAAWLHQRDVIRMTFRPDTPPGAVEALLTLLAEDPAAVRRKGGPAAAWQSLGHGAITIEQIDFTHVLDDAGPESPARAKDDIWHSIVRAVLDRRRALDDAGQQRLFEIASDILAIGDLARDVMAPNCTPDGSPLLTSQAAAVIAAYRHLVAAVDVMAPERRAEVLRNLASATAALDPHIVMQVFSAADADGQAGGPLDLPRAVAAAMDDAQVAQLLATALAVDGQATGRLASVFGTIAPDDERRRRVLGLTRSIVEASPRGQQADFGTLWTTMEELLLSYDERSFVSASYRAGLDQVGARAEALAADVPPELAALVATLEEDSVRRLSVVLLLDLLALERDAGRASELARDLSAVAEDLLLAGEHARARDVAVALAARAADRASAASEGARFALEALVHTTAFHEAMEHLGELDDPGILPLVELCEAVGPAATAALLPLLDAETPTRAGERAARIVAGYGAPAVSRLALLLASPHWYSRRNAALLLGEIRAPEAVALLQPLLRSGDPRVTQAAVRALSAIDDPAAARSVHTALRAASGDARQAVVSALVAERDPRVVPLLARILDESDAIGHDHDVVLEALGAVGVLRGDAAVPAVDRVMRRTRWFARPKLRAVKTASVRALRQIGTPAASAALSRAAADGDRLLRRVAADGGGA